MRTKVDNTIEKLIREKQSENVEAKHRNWQILKTEEKSELNN